MGPNKTDSASGPGVRLRFISTGSIRLAGRHLILQIIDMAITLQIKRMSREDKLRAMEALWVDLSRDEAEVDSPGWHGAALREAERLVREGKAQFSDWPVAKRRLRRKASRVA
jgi:hypothetical protein